MNEADYEDKIRSTWMYEMRQMMQAKVNMVIGMDKIMELDNEIGGLFSQMKEKVYAFADYLPPGKHNSCLLYNTANMPKKGMYTF